MLFSSSGLAARDKQIFNGKITKVDARYVLSNPAKKTAYQLDNQRMPETFAGLNVVVIGDLDEDTGLIHVSDMVRALSPKVAQAKFVYIDCDACPRAMGKARVAALQEIRDWNRFTVVADRTKADMVFVFAANPYLNDYVTRDGPDTRPVTISTAYMNVVDPHTGENLWGSFRRWGNWRVAGATKDLMNEFREQLEADKNDNERLLFLNRRHYSTETQEIQILDGDK